MNCLLCLVGAEIFYTDDRTNNSYFHCQNCDLRFLDPQYRLNPSEEKKRYLEHNNDVGDVRFQQFVAPLVAQIVKRLPQTALGLDFGCGTGPVLGKQLEAAGFGMNYYDPFFAADMEVLNLKYDFIVSCEVVEHFFNPRLEFENLKKTLKDSGTLGIMTLLHTDKIDFKSWYYKNDPTHVCFYSEKTFEWIRSQFGFDSVTCEGDRMVILT